MTKPPGCCERWRGKPISCCVSSAQSRHDRRLGVEAVLAQPLGVDAAAVEPLLALRRPLDALQVDAERAAGVAQRRARPVADDDGGERGAVPAVLAVDVLDHLLAALVLEVDVDVGRLVALDADEAAEQQRGAARVDLGDAQAVADQRVGGAAAALAEDALRARPGDDVGDGEEVGLVLRAAR